MDHRNSEPRTAKADRAFRRQTLKH